MGVVARLESIGPLLHRQRSGAVLRLSLRRVLKLSLCFLVFAQISGMPLNKGKGSGDEHSHEERQRDQESETVEVMKNFPLQNDLQHGLSHVVSEKGNIAKNEKEDAFDK